MINIADRLLKGSMHILDIVMEGTVSQMFYLGYSFHFMWFRKSFFKIVQNVTRLFDIKWKLRPKYKIWDTVPSERVWRIGKQNMKSVSTMAIEKSTFKKVL